MNNTNLFDSQHALHMYNVHICYHTSSSQIHLENCIYGELQSAKILFLPSKCEIIFVTLKNDNFSNIAIAILDFSLLLFSYRSSNFAIAKVVALNVFASIFV